MFNLFEDRAELELACSDNQPGEQSSLADAHRDDGKRFVVRADEKLTAYLELELAIRACDELQTCTANGSQ